MATTPTHAVPYVTGADTVTSYPTTSLALANKIEALQPRGFAQGVFPAGSTPTATFIYWGNPTVNIGSAISVPSGIDTLNLVTPGLYLLTFQIYWSTGPTWGDLEIWQYPAGASIGSSSTIGSAGRNTIGSILVHAPAAGHSLKLRTVYSTSPQTIGNGTWRIAPVNVAQV